MIVALIIPTGCVVSVENTFTAPEFEEPGPPPIEVTVEQLYAEFIADQEAAIAKYKGERLSFIGVTVEEVGSLFDVGNGVFMYNTHIMTGSVKFTPRYTVYLDNVREGFIVEIVGECRGLIRPVFREPLLQISDCWINIVEGEIIEGYYDVPYY